VGLSAVARADAPFYRFELAGPVKPYVRMTRRGKWTDAQAREYLACKARLAWQMRAVMTENNWEMLPARTPLRCYLLVWTPARLHTCDLDNLLKAVLDAAQGVVYRNDCWIDSAWAHRLAGPDAIKFGVGVLG